MTPTGLHPCPIHCLKTYSPIQWLRLSLSLFSNTSWARNDMGHALLDVMPHLHVPTCRATCTGPPAQGHLYRAAALITSLHHCTMLITSAAVFMI